MRIEVDREHVARGGKVAVISSGNEVPLITDPHACRACLKKLTFSPKLVELLEEATEMARLLGEIEEAAISTKSRKRRIAEDIAAIMDEVDFGKGAAPRLNWISQGTTCHIVRSSEPGLAEEVQEEYTGADGTVYHGRHVMSVMEDWMEKRMGGTFEVLEEAAYIPPRDDGYQTQPDDSEE